MAIAVEKNKNDDLRDEIEQISSEIIDAYLDQIEICNDKIDAETMQKLVDDQSFAVETATEAFDDEETTYSLCADGSVEADSSDGIVTEDIESVGELASALQTIAQLFLDEIDDKVRDHVRMKSGLNNAELDDLIETLDQAREADLI